MTTVYHGLSAALRTGGGRGQIGAGRTRLSPQLSPALGLVRLGNRDIKELEKEVPLPDTRSSGFLDPVAVVAKVLGAPDLFGETRH